eukprot:scaffold3769_cov164-Skeletonema_dohrnii-CCMP3373.AAC.3
MLRFCRKKSLCRWLEIRYTALSVDFCLSSSQQIRRIPSRSRAVGYFLTETIGKSRLMRIIIRPID